MVASPLDRLVTLPEGLPELTLGWGVIGWGHDWLVQPNGPRAGHRWEPTLEQVRFLLWWYAVDGDGRWLFQTACRRLAKGSGKSPSAAVLALAEFAGPARLYDFDPAVPGGCVGRATEMPLVEIAATAESQTHTTMRMVRAYAPKGSRVADQYGMDTGLTRYYRQPEGTLRVITSSAASAEGSESSAAIGDELEHWTPAAGGPELYSTIEDNLAKSGARLVGTCNAWVPGRASVAEAVFDAWVAQEEGKVRPGAGRILYDARVADPKTDLTDERSLMAAIEHVYEGCYWIDPRTILGRIWDPKSSADNSRRKYLNQPTAESGAWVTPQQWSALRDAAKVVADRDPVVLFFDGSRSRDATALVGCRMSDGHVFTVGVWEPDPAHDSVDVVPVAEVDAAVERAHDRWNVRAFFADVVEWEQFTKTTWPDRYGDRYVVKAVPGGKDPQVIAWDMRSHGQQFTLACELAQAEIEAGGFTHDGDSRTARHVVNAQRRPNRWGVSIGKESPASSRKIDAAVCVVGARMVRRLALAAAPEKTPGRVVRVR